MHDNADIRINFIIKASQAITRIIVLIFNAIIRDQA